MTWDAPPRDDRRHRSPGGPDGCTPPPAALERRGRLSVVVAVVGLVVYDVPSLVRGAAASPDPYWLVLGSFASDVLAFVAAFGAVRGQRWGVVLLLVVNTYWFLQAITGLLVAADAGATVFSAVMLVVHLVTVWLCLGRDRVAAAG